MLPTDSWWVVTYSVWPAIDAINVTFAEMQARSLLIAQQEALVQSLIGSLISMFDIEIVQPRDGGDDDDDISYVYHKTLRIPTEAIVAHIEDQGTHPRECYQRLATADQIDVVQQVATYAITLVTGLMTVKAERDDANQAVEKDAPPVLPVELVKLRHGVFLKEVLDPYRERISKLWSQEGIDQIEADHRDLLKLYHSDTIIRNAIDKHDHKTSFNDAWCLAPGRFDHLRSFCGGLATVFANTTSVESDFSILKWEMDDNRTGLMHLSLEGIFQAKQRALLQSLLK
jgi:hypothetical protein